MGNSQAGRAEVDSSAEVGNAGDQRRPIDGSPISGCRLTNCLPSPGPIDQWTAAATMCIVYYLKQITSLTKSGNSLGMIKWGGGRAATFLLGRSGGV